MSPLASYALVAVGVVGGIVGLLWAFLGPEARLGVLVAGVVAVPVQVAAFGVLLRFRSGTTGFLRAWVGGTVARLGVVGVAAGAIGWWEVLPPAPTLLALAGFLFGLLLLEPIWFRRTLGSDGSVRR